MRLREYVIVISQGCYSSLIHPSQEPSSKNRSRRIDWKSLQWHQSSYCLHPILYFVFSLCLSKRVILSLLSWHPWSGSFRAVATTLKMCCWFTNTQRHTVFPLFANISLIVPHCPLCPIALLLCHFLPHQTRMINIFINASLISSGFWQLDTTKIPFRESNSNWKVRGTKLGLSEGHVSSVPSGKYALAHQLFTHVVITLRWVYV